MLLILADDKPTTLLSFVMDIIGFFARFFEDFSNYSSIVLAAECLFVIYFPLRKKLIKCWNVRLFLFLLFWNPFVTFDIYVFVKLICCGKGSLEKNYINVISVLVSKGIYPVLTLIFGLLICFRLTSNAFSRKKFIADSISVNKPLLKFKEIKSVVLILFLNMIDYILYIFYFFIYASSTSLSLDSETLFDLWYINRAILGVSHSVNFVVYVVRIRSFRRQLINEFQDHCFFWFI